MLGRAHNHPSGCVRGLHLNTHEVMVPKAVTRYPTLTVGRASNKDTTNQGSEEINAGDIGVTNLE